jgi:hypothetical protein
MRIEVRRERRDVVIPFEEQVQRYDRVRVRAAELVDARQ